MRAISVALARFPTAVEQLTVASLTRLSVHADPLTVSEPCAGVHQAEAMYGCS